MKPPTCSSPKMRFMYMKLKFLTIVIFLFFSAQITIGQCPPLYTFTGEAAGDFFGWSVASAGDVNNDGFSDIVIGAPAEHTGSPTGSGRVYIYSGRTGQILSSFLGKALGDALGWSVSSAGDVNNDGYTDVIIGAPLSDTVGINSGLAYVISGKTGDSLYIFSGKSEIDAFGISVSSAGDVNNDGYGDLLVGATNDWLATATGRAVIFSGKNGDTLHVFNTEGAYDFFGSSVSSAGDVNKDGYDDVIIGAPTNDGTGRKAGRVYVFSGKTGDTLYLFSGKTAHDRLGQSVASAGDVNNDGFADLIFGAHGNDESGEDAGQAYVFSGSTGETLYVFNGESPYDFFGYSVSSAGDVDNDGHDDIVVGAVLNDASGESTGRVYVFSGKTGDTLNVFSGETEGDEFGLSVASAGDVNNDGFDDIIIGAWLNSAGGTGAGRAYVYSPCGIRGDFDRNGTDADVFDLTYLIDDIFRGGPDSPCILEADINSDGTPSNILDLTFLVDFIFRGGPAPGPCL